MFHENVDHLENSQVEWHENPLALDKFYESVLIFIFLTLVIGLELALCFEISSHCLFDRVQLSVKVSRDRFVMDTCRGDFKAHQQLLVMLGY